MKKPACLAAGGHFLCAGKSAADVGAVRFHVNGVKRRAAGHEQPVTLAAAKHDIGIDFRHANLADSWAVRRKHVNAVIAVTDPTHPRPYVAVFVVADTVGGLKNRLLNLSLTQGDWQPILIWDALS